MARRLLGVALLLTVLCALGPVGSVAAAEPEAGESALEERPPLPSIDEIGSKSDIAKQYLPEPYEEPSWFQWALFPLLAVGVLATLMVLTAYLVWQPKFASEQKTKRRR